MVGGVFLVALFSFVKLLLGEIFKRFSDIQTFKKYLVEEKSG